MEGVARQNIFNLLGNDSRKYHSCYITTYSFDFLFFEERVLPALKRAGITNVNLFVDGKIFQQKMADSIEVNKATQRGYSVSPIDMNGAFHPKLFLAVGKKKGLVAIGSGNLTSSGINSNEEVWSAFHFSDKEENKTEPIFAQIKAYIQDLSTNSFGFNTKKLEWLSKNAQWFNDLSFKDNSGLTYNNTKFEVLTSNADRSLYQELIKRLPKKPKSIKILAPYHNKRGQFIQNLINDVQPEIIHCIIDPLFGTIPYEMVPSEKVDFTNWNELEEDANIRRLHAKIFQFEYDNETILVFGSANASIEAFGDLEKNGTNSEVIVIASSKEKLNWFKDLGILFPDKGSYDLSQYSPIKEDEKLEIGVKNCLSYAEVDGVSSVIKLKSVIADPMLDVVLMDSSDNILLRRSLNDKDTTVIIDLPEEIVKAVFKASLFKNDTRYSNFVFVHRIDVIRRTNPDTQQERLNALINSDTFSDLELDELLEYVSFNRLGKTSGNSNRIDNNVELFNDDRIPEAVSEQEFNKNEGVIGVQGSTNTQLEVLEEFLFELTQEDKGKKSADFAESDELIAIESSTEGGLADEDFQVNTGLQRVSYAQGVRLRRKLERIIDQITSKFKDEKHLHLRAWRMKENYEKIVNIEDLKSILVGAHLILIKKNDCFYEARSIVRLRIIDRYSKRTITNGKRTERIDTMRLLEELETKFKLERYRENLSNSLDEVTYTVSENSLEKLVAELKIIPELKLIYKDESPSQLIDHHYFNTTTWVSNNNCRGVQHFLLEGVGSFLRLVNEKEPHLNELELLRWKRYKRRLLFQIVVILESFRWTRDTEITRTLFQLNLFYSLLKDEVGVNEFKIDLETSITKALEKGYQGEFNVSRIIDLYQKYFAWINTYEANPKTLKETLDHKSVKQIVFNKSLGFARVEHVFGDYRVNLSSPLGSYNAERKIYGFVDVIIGLKPCFY